MSKRAEVLVRGLIEDDEGRILLVRHTSRDWWFFPGGHIERGETTSDCLQRELREEGELDVHPTGLSAVIEHRYREDGEDRIELNVLLRARSTGTIGAVEEKLEFRWVSVDELKDVEVLPESLKEVALNASQPSVTVVLEGLARGSDDETTPEKP
jgi:8-oxo-dGTP diphosphatase